MNDEVAATAAKLKMRLDFYRAEDRHECTLMHYRMLWLLSSQGFLFAVYFALSGGQTTRDSRSLLILALCICSALIAWRIRIAIKQAEDVIDRWHILERKVFTDAEESKELKDYFAAYDIKRQWGEASKDPYQVESFKCQKEIPYMIVFLWILLLLFSLFNNFKWTP